MPADEENQIRKLTSNEVLTSLKLKTMTHGYEEVAEAHIGTYNWIFDKETDSDIKMTNFADWMKTGEGLYWAKGKAVSGKSTLIKCTYDDAQLWYSLSKWARGTSLYICIFLLLEQR